MKQVWVVIDRFGILKVFSNVRSSAKYMDEYKQEWPKSPVWVTQFKVQS